MKRYLLAILLTIFPQNVNAIETDKYAHAGISYAITAVAYGACKKAFHLGPDEPKFGCVLAAVIASTMVGGIKEATDRHGDRDDFLANFAGNVGAAITISVFEF